MFISIFRKFKELSHSQYYWLAYIALGISLLGMALFYHHVLDVMPCVVCIQVRLLALLLIAIAIIGLLSRGNRTVNAISHLSILISNAVFVERSYLLLGTERGFVFSDCGFDLGLPAWLAIDEWLPWLFRVEASCGYTPELIFGITMAEVMMLLSVLLLFVSFCVFLVVLLNIKQGDKTL